MIKWFQIRGPVFNSAIRFNVRFEQLIASVSEIWMGVLYSGTYSTGYGRHYRSVDGTRMNYLFGNRRCPEINCKSVLVHTETSDDYQFKAWISQVLWLIVFGISIGVPSKRFRDFKKNLFSLFYHFFYISNRRKTTSCPANFYHTSL